MSPRLNPQRFIAQWRRSSRLYQLLSWLTGGAFGAFLFIGAIAAIALVPALQPLWFVLPPLSLVYGFVWGWLGVRHIAERSGIVLNETVLERSVVWQWHLGLLASIPLFWLLVVLAFAVYGSFLALSTPHDALPPPSQLPPPPSPGAEAEPVQVGFVATTYVTLTVLGALFGRGMVALWSVVVALPHFVQELRFELNKGAWR